MNKLLTSALLLMPMLVANNVLAQEDANVALGLNDLGEGEGAVNLGQRPLKETIGAIINLILSFLGILATLIILLGGFKWMTSQGDSVKVDEAKKLIGEGVVGLVIIFAAYAISTFVLRELYNATAVSE